MINEILFTLSFFVTKGFTSPLIILYISNIISVFTRRLPFSTSFGRVYGARPLLRQFSSVKCRGIRFRLLLFRREYPCLSPYRHLIINDSDSQKINGMNPKASHGPNSAPRGGELDPIDPMTLTLVL